MPVAKVRKSTASSKMKKPKRVLPRTVRNSKVARWGNSLAFRIPQEVADRLNLTDGGQVSLEVQDNSFTVRPVRKRWSEAELLKRVTPEMVGGNRPLGKNERGMGRFAGMIGGSFATVFLLLVVGILTIVVAVAIRGS